MLVAPSSITEVYKVVFSMDNRKSPYPNRTSPTFYKQYWNIIGKDVHSVIEEYFKNTKLNRAANHTFIALILKKVAANRVDQFRPIGLCNVAYKIITKVIATHLKTLFDGLIHPNKFVFIPNRWIVENGSINHEVMVYLNSKKGCNVYMTIKVNMAKAYGKVE